MRFTFISTAFALLLAGVSALDKPLDIEIQNAEACTTKTKRGAQDSN